MDGIGPKSNRPRKLEPAWLGVESNQFGTDEFMLWCEKVGCEPYIALNMGTGTLEEGGSDFPCLTCDVFVFRRTAKWLCRITVQVERTVLTRSAAMGWLEYCNSATDSYYANLRRANGRDKPWNVKYWALGNEMWGPW